MRQLQAELKCSRCGQWWPRERVVHIKGNNVCRECYRRYRRRFASKVRSWQWARRLK